MIRELNKIDTTFVKKWTTLELAENISNICKPLQQIFGVTSFVYRKTYNDGNRIYLTNHAERLEWYFNNHYYLIDGYQEHPSKYQSAHVIWPLHPHTIQFDQLLYERFSLVNGFSLIYKQDDSFEIISLTTPEQKHITVNTYINNIELLEKFILYFREVAKPLIKKVSVSGKIKFLLSYPDNYIISPKLDDEDIQTFIKYIKLKRNIIVIGKKQIIISNREYECLNELMLGKPIKLIAKNLKLSPRTVETYINHIKEKVGLHSQKELIAHIANMF